MEFNSSNVFKPKNWLFVSHPIKQDEFGGKLNKKEVFKLIFCNQISLFSLFYCIDYTPYEKHPLIHYIRATTSY